MMVWMFVYYARSVVIVDGDDDFNCESASMVDGWVGTDGVGREVVGEQIVLVREGGVVVLVFLFSSLSPPPPLPF